MPEIDLNQWFTQLLLRLQQNHQRQLVSLHGGGDYCQQALQQLIELDPSLLLLSNRAIAECAVPFSKAESRLGGESRLVVVDLFSGLNPDVLCIAAGLVKAGGVLVLLSPRVEDWTTVDDQYARWQDGTISPDPVFVNYFFGALRDDTNFGIFVVEGSSAPVIAEQEKLHLIPLVDGKTAEQVSALQILQQWFFSNDRRIVLLVADRGRGKSSCLGLFAAQLLAENDIKILVTSASRQAAAQLLQFSDKIEFIAPDKLIESRPHADIVLVDEAAMIPQSMLRRVGRLYPRLVMATTSGGYEGTGQGFVLRFIADYSAERVLRMSLQNPIRWCPQDKLEGWLNKTLLMDTDEALANSNKISVKDCQFHLHRDMSVQHRLTLVLQIYRLLSVAHYRTRPSDLRMLMENPDLVFVTATFESKIIAAAVLNREGGFDESLTDQIFLGRRRPKGHLLAQMLTAQAAARGFACFKGLRVQRIAVAQNARRLGVGSRLIQLSIDYARSENIDYLGASFALNKSTGSFWRQLDFDLVHVSFATGKSSGLHSIAILKPLNEALSHSVIEMKCRVSQQLASWLTQFLSGMASSDVVTLLRYINYQMPLSEMDSNEVDAFVQGNRGFELCFVSLQRYVMNLIASTIGDVDELLVAKAVQNRSWPSLDSIAATNGKKQTDQLIRRLVDALSKA